MKYITYIYIILCIIWWDQSTNHGPNIHNYVLFEESIKPEASYDSSSFVYYRLFPLFHEREFHRGIPSVHHGGYFLRFFFWKSIYVIYNTIWNSMWFNIKMVKLTSHISLAKVYNQHSNTDCSNSLLFRLVFLPIIPITTLPLWLKEL